MFNLWLLFGGILALLVFLYCKYINFKRIEDDKSVRHVFGITTPTIVDGIIILVVFVVIIKFSYI